MLENRKGLCAFVGLVAVSNQLNACSWIILKEAKKLPDISYLSRSLM
jgi:hypothetical protein